MSFSFKQFHINDDQCAMKVGTDSILLGALVEVNNAQRILDIGCGCGLLALMMAQRTADKADIIAVEIEQRAAKQAQENVNSSPWTQRVEVLQTDINNFKTEQQFDLIVSNPPYFSDSLLGPDTTRNTARHTQSLSQLQLLNNAQALLSTNGVFWLVLPVNVAEQFITLSGTSSTLHLSHLCRVHSVNGKPAYRYVMAFSKLEPEEVAQSDIDVYDDNNQYSSKFIALTKNFYLNR
jgi:tRNA1Val (adenine37-N6)-methyltransferase